MELFYLFLADAKAGAVNCDKFVVVLIPRQIDAQLLKSPSRHHQNDQDKSEKVLLERHDNRRWL